jgi:hypothetical protein
MLFAQGETYVTHPYIMQDKIISTNTLYNPYWFVFKRFQFMFFIHSEINVSRPYITQGTITTLEIL